MLQFLQPILLFSVAGIAIPVIIHLWNIKSGKTLKIGSISLLSQGSKQSARSLKLTDLLLLFLRCLLLTLLVLLISQPIWKQQVSVNVEKGWIMLEKESLQEDYKNNTFTIDSLLKAGYEFHYFNPAFKKDNLKEALKIQKDTLHNPVSYWSLLTRLNEEIPASLPVYLFTKNRLNRFAGERPQLSLNLYWHTYIPSDSVAVWPENAFLTSSDSVHLSIGHSQPLATFFTHKNLPLAQMSDAEYHVDVIDGKLIVSSKDDAKDKNAINKSNIEVDTSIIRISVFTDKFYSDANYVKAATEAIGKFSKRKLQLSVTNNYKDIPANQDWVFWLSEQNIPAFVDGKNIFMYESGKPENIDTWIIPEDISAASHEAIAISKAIAHNTLNEAEIIWKDGFGNPILNKEVKNKTSVFHFYSRFDPQWNELAWSGEFPKLLFTLIFKKENEKAPFYNDKRIIDQSQIPPLYIRENDITNENKFTKITDLTHVFWMASFIIFLLERLLSFRTKRGVKSV